ncbi:MAG: serine/threonine protein kinase, partial [Myxococcales bacterium]|nr:serine/threonine protein kinase [Myxococcales bacterium]
QSLAALGQQLFARGLALDWRHAIDLVLGAIDGLDAIHRAVHPETGEPLGIVHRDLAPKNLMVTPSASMVVIDLGLGKSNLQDWATRTGALMGTPRYMSPEQLRGARTDARSDVYGMGVVCFELLTGVRYIEAGELHEVLRRVLDHPFRPPTALARQLPPALDPLLQRALALEVDERLPSMAALGAGLRAVLGDSRASIRD